MTAKATWPYDADEHDPLTALRIPVTSSHPGWRYTACFDRESEARPTDAEARMIASFIEQYQDYFFGDGWWRKKQQAQEFDMDCYTTSVFHKWADDDWSYRCVTWQYGVFWAPVFPRQRGGEYDTTNAKGPMTLVQVMDYIHTIGDGQPMQHWLDWMTAHPDVFGDPS
jgi:hypothetical protein